MPLGPGRGNKDETELTRDRLISLGHTAKSERPRCVEMTLKTAVQSEPSLRNSQTRCMNLDVSHDQKPVLGTPIARV